ncbi:uncharacterized protein RNJ42_05059 [Nakaseomyces bracarensis]|uniref:uncharacterized protein n=1 Tax=Nakaseomyces bracarensis TaxID=273131 RepID=UPI00387297EC
MVAFNGTLHRYAPKHVAFEFEPLAYKKVVVMIGGMTDGLLTVPFVDRMGPILNEVDYGLIQIQLTSSFKGYGTTSLDNDINEIEMLIKYLKSEAGGNRDKIILMGHSTGSQDVIHYILKKGSYGIDAAVLQGSCSDREAFADEVGIEELNKLNELPLKLVSEGKGDELLPSVYANQMGGTPVTAYRWSSLMTKGGDDDYFSSDLGEEAWKSTLGQITIPFLVAYPENDEFVPSFIDKVKLLKTWEKCSNPLYWSKCSGLIKGGMHWLPETNSQDYFYDMLTKFINEFSL